MFQSNMLRPMSYLVNVKLKLTQFSFSKLVCAQFTFSHIYCMLFQWKPDQSTHITGKTNAQDWVLNKGNNKKQKKVCTPKLKKCKINYSRLTRVTFWARRSSSDSVFYVIIYFCLHLTCFTNLFFFTDVDMPFLNPFPFAFHSPNKSTIFNFQLSGILVIL